MGPHVTHTALHTCTHTPTLPHIPLLPVSHTAPHTATCTLLRTEGIHLQMRRFPTNSMVLADLRIRHSHTHTPFCSCHPHTPRTCRLFYPHTHHTHTPMVVPTPPTRDLFSRLQALDGWWTGLFRVPNTGRVARLHIACPTCTAPLPSHGHAHFCRPSPTTAVVARTPPHHHLCPLYERTPLPSATSATPATSPTTPTPSPWDWAPLPTSTHPHHYLAGQGHGCFPVWDGTPSTCTPRPHMPPPPPLTHK